MYNKLLFGIVALTVVLGGAILLTSRQKTAPTAPSSPTTSKQSTSQPTQTTGPQGQQEATATVEVTTAGFSPQTLTVKSGARVTWVNKGAGIVTVHSAVHATHLVYPALNLGEFGDDSSVQLVFDKAGTYKYHNHLNPSMTGTVVVE